MAKGYFGGGGGTAADPYLIEDAADFNRIRAYPTASFRLVNSVDLGEPPFNRGFMPIQSFTGRLDGAGFKVMNLYINRPASSNVALFATSSYALGSYTPATAPVVKNIAFVNASVTGAANVAVVIANLTYTANSGTANCAPMFRNVYVSGRVTGTTNVGSLVGLFMFSSNGVAQTIADGVHVNASLKATDANGVLAGVTGCAPAVNQQLIAYANVLVDVKPTCLGSVDPVSFSTCAGGQTTYKIPMTAVYHNADSWGLAVQSPNTVALTARQLLSNDGLDALMVAVTEDGSSTFRFRYGVFPELAIRKGNVVFVRNGGDLYDYDPASATFVKVLTGTQPYQTVAKLGGIDVAGLTTIALTKLRQQLGDQVELVAYVDRATGSTVSSSTTTMTRDAAHDYGERLCFRTTYTLGDNVVGVEHVNGGDANG